MTDKQKLLELADSFGVALDETALDRFDIYAEQLVDWNEKINLTAITDPEGITIKHFADSLSVFSAAEFSRGASVIDVGTGAGFPGLAMKIARSDLEVTLLDSTRKKLNVIDDIAAKLGLEVTTVHARAAEINKKETFAGQFDFAVARAVAELKKLSGWCLPFVKKGGAFIAMKGAKAEDELKAAEGVVRKLGGTVEKVLSFDLADAGERNIILIRKSK